jgi:hypothetical protein
MQNETRPALLSYYSAGARVYFSRLWLTGRNKNFDSIIDAFKLLQGRTQYLVEFEQMRRGIKQGGVSAEV